MLCICLSITASRIPYVSGTRCHICLKEFWVRESLLNHIRRGRTPCKLQALLLGPLLTECEADEVDLELRPFLPGPTQAWSTQACNFRSLCPCERSFAPEAVWPRAHRTRIHVLACFLAGLFFARLYSVISLAAHFPVWVPKWSPIGGNYRPNKRCI